MLLRILDMREKVVRLTRELVQKEKEAKETDVIYAQLRSTYLEPPNSEILDCIDQKSDVPYKKRKRDLSLKIYQPFYGVY